MNSMGGSATRSLMVALITAALAFSGYEASAGEECEELLNGVTQFSSVDEILAALKELPPYILDYHNLKQSIESLMNDLSELKQPYQGLKAIESAYREGKLDSELLYQLSQSLTESVKQETLKTLQTPDSLMRQKKLEGERILLSRLQRLKRKALDALLPETPNSEEPKPLEQDSKELANDGERESKLNLSDLARSIEEQLSQDLEREVDPRDVEELSEEQLQELAKEAAPSVLKQNQSEDSDQKTSPSKKTEAQESIEKRLKEMIEKALTKESKPDKEKKKGEKDPDSDKQEGDKGSSDKDIGEKGEAKEEQLQEGSEGEGEQEGESEPQGQGDSKEGQGQVGSQGEGEQEGQGNSKEGQSKGEKSAQGKGRGDSQGESDSPAAKSHGKHPGEGGRKEGQLGKEQTRESHGNAEKGNDGVVEGGGHGMKDLVNSLSSTLKWLQLQKKDLQTSAKKGASSRDKLNRQELERLARSKRLDAAMAKQGRRQDERFERPIENEEQLSLKELLDATWKNLLSEYQNSERFERQLADFASLCQSLTQTNGGTQAHVIKHYAQKAYDLIESLRRMNIAYKDLNELALLLPSKESRATSLRRMRFLERLLSEKQRSSQLKDVEESTLELVRSILSTAEGGSASPSNKQTAEALREQLLGPLSRKALDQAYPSANSRDDLNYDQAVAALKSGKLDDLLLFARLASYVNILLYDTYKPKYHERHDGPHGPINEADFVLERLEDFEDISHVLKENNPSKLEIVRLIAGDLLKLAYPEKTKKSDPRKPFPKRASIVLYDISGSMSRAHKQDLRNAIVNAYIDKSQTEVARGEGEHILYLIPFDARPHEPRRITSLSEAQTFFDDMRARPLGSGGDDSITEGMVKAYKLIAEHQKNGGELERGSILLITDAVAKIHFEAIEKARALIDPSVDLALNAITMGDWNEDVSKMITKYSINGDGEIGKVSHQHIPYEEIIRLLNLNGFREELLKDAKNFVSDARTNEIPQGALDRLRTSLLKVSSSYENDEKAAAVRSERWISQLERLHVPPAQRPAVLLHGYLDLFIAMVSSNVGKDWTMSARVAAWEEFVEFAERKTGLAPSEVFANAKAQQKKLILKWLKI